MRQYFYGEIELAEKLSAEKIEQLKAAIAMIIDDNLDEQEHEVLMVSFSK